MLILSAAAAATAMGGCLGKQSLWKVLGQTDSPAEAFKTVFGQYGDRGEYMDGYSKQAMITRCREDYKWDEDKDDDCSKERANMISHLYDNERLWEHVNMVAFAEHYVLDGESPFYTFQKQKQESQQDWPIFGGVVWSGWEGKNDDNGKLLSFSRAGIDYVRLECNFGTDDNIGGKDRLSDSPCRDRFSHLAKSAKACQDLEMVPLILLQFPWRDPDISIAYFREAVKAFASSLNQAGVESRRVLFETRPPIGLSAQEERGLSGTEKVALGLDIGKIMFGVFDECFPNKIAGFCVAGGSTKGEFPTAMEDDTQNAVRQGMRHSARQKWGYDLCFWEMGAKLMLQPKVGRLWGQNTQASRDAARELFCINAQDLADEIQESKIQ